MTPGTGENLKASLSSVSSNQDPRGGGFLKDSLSKKKKEKDNKEMKRFN